MPRIRDNNAFSRGQAVCFQNHRASESLDCLQRIRFGFGGDETRGRDPCALHELLGEDLASFELGGTAGRTDNQTARRPERVHHARHQRRLGSDNGQAGAYAFGNLKQIFRG